MKSINSTFSVILDGLSQVMFPDVCLCCGAEALKGDRLICSFCINRRFEDADPENSASASGVILPQNVCLQQALWKFDKGGELQQLMHALKYERLTAVGTQLGRVLARRAKKHPQVESSINRENSLLIPVPLHYLKFRKRGFNQAFYIARGIETVLAIPICPIDAVVRQKFTRSQTGFTLQKRLKNMEGAFRVREPEILKNKRIIIVDDVFTTGATSFELAQTLTEAGAGPIMVWTIAQA